MKTLVTAFSILFLSVGMYAQTAATLTSTNSLVVPSGPKTDVYTISRTQLKLVQSFVSKAGEIEAYAISFDLAGSYFTKKVDGKLLPGDIKTALVGTAAGTKFYLDDVTIKSYTDATQKVVACQFTIVD